tara:strand:+ start:1344 stop:2012 length:669 start_codon:yes stop_codon:yes gene_type:complete
MSTIISFYQAKIVFAFNQFDKNNIITNFILEEIHPKFNSQEDIDKELDSYPAKSRKRFYSILVNIKVAIKKMTSKENNNVRFTLEDEYFQLLQNLKTNNVKYKVPSILVKYRKDINPIRALKFELQEIMAMPESDDDYYLWIIKQYRNERKISEIIKDVNIDMENIKKMQEKYRSAKKNYDYFILPMSYYHCVEIETDMKSWVSTLREFYIWTQNSINQRYL